MSRRDLPHVRITSSGGTFLGRQKLPSFYSESNAQTGLKNLKIQDVGEISSSSEDFDSSALSDDTAADLLEGIFHQADIDSKREAKQVLERYKEGLVTDQTERLSRVSEEIKSKEDRILSEFMQRKMKLEEELSHACKCEVISPATSPIMQMAEKQKQLRVGNESEFKTRLENFHSAMMKKEEHEVHNGEVKLVMEKFKNLLTKCENGPESEPIKQLKKMLQTNIDGLSTVNVDGSDFEKMIAAANKAAEDCINFFDKLTNEKKAPTQPEVKQPPTATVQITSNVKSSEPAPVDEDLTKVAADAVNLVEQWRNRLKTLQDDPNLKTQRSLLQRAVISLVNMLSSQSEASALIPDKLNNLLNGQQVEITGKMITTTVHPLAADYCKFFICKKIIVSLDFSIKCFIHCFIISGTRRRRGVLSTFCSWPSCFSCITIGFIKARYGPVIFGLFLFIMPFIGST